MKIVWASPIDARSAIGRFSVAVADALAARGHRVTFVRLDQDESRPAHPCRCELKSWRSIERDELARQDAVFVNLGDNFLFHAGAFRLLAEARCVGVFHDFYLHNLFLGWLADRGLGEADHRATLSAVYGEEGRAAAGDLRANALSLEEIAARFPMTEWLAQRCAGAMSHSAFYAARLKAACAGPVATQWLAWPARADFPPPTEKADGETVRVLTIGVVNSNKCVDRIVAAIGGDSELAARLRYVVAGPVTGDERKRLEAIAEDLRYAHLELLGEVDDARLVAEIEAADIISCLRKPVLEGGSASAIEGLLSGRPVIVADAGFYADLPNEFVVKVGAEVAVEDLRGALRGLAADAAARRDKGQRAAAWAAGAFSVETYADGVEAVAKDVVAAGPSAAVASHFGAELCSLGIESPALRDRVAARLAPLFDMS